MPRRDTLARRKPGRPTRLTDELADRVITAVERGNHISTACALAHVPVGTLYRWLEYGTDVEHAIETGQDYNPDHLKFREFREALAEARARAEERAVDVVERSMAGGYVISEEVVLDASGNPARDDNGEILYNRTYSQPDGRLALSYLGRSRPGVWGQNPTQRLEVTMGPDLTGGAEGEEDMDNAARLSQRLAAIAAARAEEDPEGYGPDDEGVYDAELVEEGADSGT